MAVRIVSGSSEQHARGPRAAGFTHVSVVTTAAKSPQLFTRSSAVDTQLVCCPPDVFETEIANVPARIFRRRERRTTLDRAISEEHTSELQSRLHLVCRLLLEK